MRSKAMSRFIDSGSTMNIIIKGKLTIRPGENIYLIFWSCLSPCRELYSFGNN